MKRVAARKFRRRPFGWCCAWASRTSKSSGRRSRKERMKRVGRVEILHEAFLAVMRAGQASSGRAYCRMGNSLYPGGT